MLLLSRQLLHVGMWVLEPSWLRLLRLLRNERRLRCGKQRLLHQQWLLRRSVLHGRLAVLLLQVRRQVGRAGPLQLAGMHAQLRWLQRLLRLVARLPEMQLMLLELRPRRSGH